MELLATLRECSRVDWYFPTTEAKQAHIATLLRLNAVACCPKRYLYTITSVGVALLKNTDS